MIILEGNLTEIITNRNVLILWSSGSDSNFSPRVTFILECKAMNMRIFTVVLFVIKVVEQSVQCGMICGNDQKGLVLVYKF